MSRARDLATVLPVVALLAVLFGAGMMVRALSSMKDERLRLDQKGRDLAALQVLEDESWRLDALAEAIGSHGPDALVELSGLVNSALPDYQGAEFTTLNQTSSGEWVAHRRKVTFKNVPIPGMMRFIRSAENARPQWKLTACDLNSTASRPGYGNAELVFTALSR